MTKTGPRSRYLRSCHFPSRPSAGGRYDYHRCFSHHSAADNRVNVSLGVRSLKTPSASMPARCGGGQMTFCAWRKAG